MYVVKNIVRLLSPSPVKLILVDNRYGVRIEGNGTTFVGEELAVVRRYRVEVWGQPVPKYMLQLWHDDKLANVIFTDDRGRATVKLMDLGKWKVLAATRGVAELVGLEDFFKVFKYNETIQMAGIVELSARSLGRTSSMVHAITKYRNNRRYEASVGIKGVKKWIADRVYGTLTRRGFDVERKNVEDAANELLEPVVAWIVRRFDEHWYYSYGCKRHWGRVTWGSGASRAEVRDVRRTITFVVVGKRISKTLSGTAIVVANYRVRPDWYCKAEPWWGVGFVTGYVYVDVELVELTVAPAEARLDLSISTIVADDQPTREWSVRITGADKCKIGGLPKCSATIKVGPAGIRVV